MTAASPSNQNHITLSRLHLVLAAAYAILFGLQFLFSLSTLTESGKIAVNILTIAMPMLHISLAWGSKNKSEIARKISPIVGILMLIGFPIGTILGLYLIRFSDWKSLPDQKVYVAAANNMQSSLQKTGIKHSLLQKVGIVLFLISPLAFAIVFVDVALGSHIFSSNIFPRNMIMGVHWGSILGMLTLSPIGIILFFIGVWLNPTRK